MYRLVILAALFAAVACSSQEEGGDVGMADEGAAEVAGNVVEAKASATELVEDGEASGQEALADTKESATEAAAAMDTPAK